MKNRDFFAVMKKELKRFFGDRRLLFSTVIMPGLMIYIMYTIMGQVMSDAFSPDKDYKPTVYVSGLTTTGQGILEGLKLSYKEIPDSSLEQYQKKVENKKADLLITFSPDFDAAVAAYTPGDKDKTAPQIGIYYNSSETESETLYQTLTQAFDQYESLLTNKFDVNAGKEAYDLASKEDTSAKMFSMLVPMLLIMMLISGCMAIAPDAIAGEKERGTIATLLVTPVRRSEIAVGKILSLSLIAILSGSSSFLGVMISLPKLMGDSADELSAAVYSPTDYVMLLLVVLSTVLVVIVLFSLISTNAKTVKEAASASSPLMILGMIVAVTSSMGSGAQKQLAMYLIPVYNSAQCMNGIFSMTYSKSQVMVTFGINLLATAVGVYVMTRMFESEKVMFSK